MYGNDQDSDTINIKSTAKRNGLSTLLLGLSLLLVSTVLATLLPNSMFLVAIFIMSASFVTILIGIFKLREPAYSLAISKVSIVYHSRVGKWTLDWKNIQRIDTPKVHLGLDAQSLPFVGIKIKDYRPLLENISPRLVTNLLLEQRPLLMNKNGCESGQCYSEHLLENDTFRLPDGQVVKGIKAMLANRMTALRKQLGFDLFISAAELDRESEAFVTLLKQCQNQIALDPPAR